MYAQRRELTKNIISILKPKKKYTVVDFVEKNMLIEVNGVSTYWRSEKTPYLIEPMNNIDDNGTSSVLLLGMARSGKTEGLIKGGLCYSMFCDFCDSMFVDTTRDNVETFVKDHVQPMMDNNPNLSKFRTGRKTDYTLSYIRTNQGNKTKFRYPVNHTFKSKTLKRVFITEFSEISVSDGDAFFLALKRTATFGMKGTLAVEGTCVGTYQGDVSDNPFDIPVIDTCNITKAWQRSSKHVYHWQCPHCSDFFIPDFDCVHFDKEETCREKAAQDAFLACSSCCAVIDWTIENRYELNAGGKYISKYENPQTRHKGYRIPVLCAAFDSDPRENVVAAYIDAKNEFELKGTTDALQTFHNTTLGLPYITDGSRFEQKIQYRENINQVPSGVCPQETIALLASVDVQGGDRRGFEYAVVAVLPNNRKALVERGYMRTINDKDVHPHKNVEHWQVCLIDRLLERWFVCEDKKTLFKPLAVVYDTNGEVGVSDTAKQFRKSQPKSIRPRLMPIKGALLKVKRMQLAKCRSFYLIHVDRIKDTLYRDLQYKHDESNGYQFYQNFPDRFMQELESEERNEKGHWDKVQRKNETWDLLVYLQIAIEFFQKYLTKRRKGFYKDEDEQTD